MRLPDSFTLGPAVARPLDVGGLDPSLASLGLARTGTGMAPVLHRVKTDPRTPIHKRIDRLLGEVEGHLVYPARVDVVVVEGILSHMPGAEAHLRLAGLHWLILHKLWELGLPYAVVAPSSRMKWLTGKGRVEKGEALAAAIHRFGPLFPEPGEGEELDESRMITGDDTADAITLAAMGKAAYGQPLVKMPLDREPLLHANKLTGPPGRKIQVPVIDWPRLDGAV